ncbi:PucR family transcriptional regulator [Streptomyces sp. BI20]|uniref:PucR family transcriptional regulator n=1 Tax=Streptomyces sp. BI20 TaxID=3403460 RepID=UPI003C776F57
MKGDYQELVDEISALLGAPATLENRDFRLIAFGAHDSDDDLAMDPVRTRSILTRQSTAAVRSWFEGFGITRATGPVRIPAAPEAGVFRGRICLPVRHRGIVHGYVWLLDRDGPRATDGAEPGPGPAALAAAMAVAERIGRQLAAEARAGADLSRELAAALTAAPGPARERALAALARALGEPEPGSAEGRGEGGSEGAAGAPGAAYALVCVDPWQGEAPASVPGAVAVASVAVPAAGTPGGPGPTGGLMGGGAGRTALAVLVRPRGTELPAATLAAVERVREAEPGRTAGVSYGRPGPAWLPGTWEQAVAAARAARARPGLGPVARWSAIGPYRMLSVLAARGGEDPATRELLGPAHPELARTAEVFLDCAGQAGRAAAALGIHRQTLYYRLERVERLTGLDLDEGEDRLLLHMAIKAARLR